MITPSLCSYCEEPINGDMKIIKNVKSNKYYWLHYPHCYVCFDTFKLSRKQLLERGILHEPPQY